MKCFGVFICIALIVNAFSVIFSPVFAQGIDRQTESGNIQNTQTSSSDIQATVLRVFDNGKQSLETLRGTWIQRGGGEEATTVETVLSFLAESKTSYQNARSYGKTQSEAIAEARTLFLDKTAGINSEVSSAGVSSIVMQIGNDLRTLMTSSVSSAAPGSTVFANLELANADAASGTQLKQATQAAEKKILDTSQCQIFRFSLINCVDALFSFIIKNTLLQIAGFLVWLSANMLNYAIQISILDFAKWAPSSLYPIWIVVRQIVSLAVVFAGLWLGFMYIVGRETGFGRYVAWLIIFALFVNFSYPITRVLTDVSNIISLNIYASAVGSDTLGTDFSTAVAPWSGQNTAGAIIVNRLGLQGLAVSATQVQSEQAGFIQGINSTPGALIAVMFVFYAAYVFLMATGIIAVRSVLLILLIVGSPILLVDSVIPKLGDAAMKLRKMFFEQLVSAPVFMIMLALTLKFMEIFQAPGGPLQAGGQITSALQTSGEGTIQTFFSILIMLIMLHVMLKVTKSVAGSAGEFATKWAGKVGGFGLGVASGGAGLLARGSIGAAAARMRDSGWMDKLQGSRTGRGLYSLSNSLAQSTFDTRNVGMVSKGLGAAGITSIGGVGMQQGLKQNYDQNFDAKLKTVTEKQRSIKDSGARAEYLSQVGNNAGSTMQRAVLFGRKSDNQLIREKIESKQKDIYDQWGSIQDKDRKSKFYLEHKADIDMAKERFGAVSIETTKSEAAAEALAEIERTAPQTNKTETANGSMPPTRSEAPYVPTTAKGSSTTILSQTAEPMSEKELKERDTPAYMRKENASGQASTTADIEKSIPPLEQSQKTASSEPPLEQSQAAATGRSMYPEEIERMQKKFDMHASWRKRRKGGDTDPDDDVNSAFAVKPNKPKSPAPGQGAIPE